MSFFSLVRQILSIDISKMSEPPVLPPLRHKRKQADPRRTIGSIVTTKAVLVTSISKCARLYGRNAKTKRISGEVVSVVVDRSKQRARTLVEVDCNLRTSVRRKTLHISSIQATKTRMANNDEVSPLHGNIRATKFLTPETLAHQESWDQDEDIRREIHELFQTTPKRVSPDHPTAHKNAPETAPSASNRQQNARISPFSRDGTLDR